VRAVQGPLDLGQRRKQATREDARLDPVGAPALPLVGHVREGDGLEAHPAAGPQGAVAGFEVRREVIGAHGLEHLDRDDRVVGALDVPVVAKLDAHAIRQAGRRDTCGGQPVLGGRHGDGRDPAAQLARGVQREPAPAAADLENVLAAAQAGPLRDDPVLVALGVGERLVGHLEHRARVGHRLVEEQPVELVAEVVVGLDVAPAPGTGVAARPVRQRLPEPEREAPPSIRQREGLAVERRHLEQGRQIRAGPQAVHVRLAGADVAAEEHADRGGLLVDVDLADVRRGGVPVHLARAVRQDHGQAPHADPSCGAEHHAARRLLDDSPGQDAGATAGRELGAHGVASRARVQAPWLKNGAPRRHSRSACHRIIAIVLCVTNG
jgi:hypothetical protein